MLKALLQSIADTNGWNFLFGSEKDFNIAADWVDPNAPTLFMSGYGTAFSASYDAQGARIATYSVLLFLVTQSQITDEPENRQPYFDDIERLSDILVGGLIKGSVTWSNESRLEIKNLNDQNTDGHRITGSITFPAVRPPC